MTKNIEKRTDELFALGLKWDGEHYTDNTFFIHYVDMTIYDEKNWKMLIEKIKIHRQIEKTSKEFSNILKEWLSPENNEGVDVFSRMIQAHVEGNYKNNPAICVSHDYCDANQAMIDAFKKVYGFDPEPMDDAHSSILNEVWHIAKQNDFYA